MKHGIFQYEITTKTQLFSVEHSEKFRYIELIRENKNLLKLHKIKNLPSLENELANERKISIKTFFAICIIENMNIYLVDNRKIYVNILDETLPVNIVLKNKYNYSIDFRITDEKLNNYKDNYLIINNFEDKLRSISAYKLEELHEICRKLNLTVPTKNGKKINKTELFAFINDNYDN